MTDTNTIPTDSKFLTFERRIVLNRKTPIILVQSKSGGYLLGKIKWYGAWRQYCFYPEPETIFNTGCMDDIQRVILDLMADR